MPEDLQFLLKFIMDSADSIAWIHLAPSCGTASRARERPVNPKLLNGRPPPRPLRSSDRPDGLEDLTPTEAQRVLSANASYHATQQIVHTAHNLSICTSIENPGNSLFWATTWTEELLRTIPGFWTFFHSCQHGGDRDKLTAWWCNKDWFLPLAAQCKRDHAHRPWTPALQGKQLVFPTAEEAAYPMLLCERLSCILQQQTVHFCRPAFRCQQVITQVCRAWPTSGQQGQTTCLLLLALCLACSANT